MASCPSSRPGWRCRPRTGPAALAVRALGPAAQQQLSTDGARGQPPSLATLADLERLTDLLAVEDRRFLNDFKLALQRGAQVFEAHEQHTLTRGRRALLEAVQQLPAVLGQYYARVAAGSLAASPASPAA